MFCRPLLVRLLSLAAAFAISCSTIATAQDETPRQLALKEVRAAMAARDVAGIKAKLEAAARLKGEEPYDTELHRVEQLAGYVTQFWNAVDRAGRTMQATTIREITINDKICAFVEYENKTLVIRVEGQNRTYTLQNMPPAVALAVAQQELDPKNANNKVFFGAFLAMDAKGDRKIARQYWDEATQAKVDIKHLLPELGVEPPPPAVILPTLSPLVKATLQPKNWSLRTKGAKNWQKKPLGDAAAQNEAGHLVVKTPTDAGEVQLVFGRQLTPNFVCRVYLEGAKKGQSIGLVSVDGDEDALTTLLPSGTVVIEMGRQAGQVKAKIHGKEVEFTTAGKATPRTPALFGIIVPAGSEITVASFELGVP
ncbi:hypothetical protein ETAA8_10350 [Anatilimnocola aggregata]|uniref:Uncharacterized protein n=1 Tax=Anatilimnocola aggregata TaxID=2528021 RepID=A0A517Y6V6_9BACT|nr:hypothetical protein [Anatilimnocola aggregata]QDU25963.1 hypothetical protein ETAA8_10350 [Anatilimnocola aggregata]